MSLSRLAFYHKLAHRYNQQHAIKTGRQFRGGRTTSNQSVKKLF